MISESIVNSLTTSSNGTKENTKSTIATIKAIIQYVSKTALLILICGNKRMDRVIPKNDVAEITSVGIIPKQLCSFLKEKQRKSEKSENDEI